MRSLIGKYLRTAISILKKPGIRQHVARSVAVRADGVDGEERGVEVLIHHLTVCAVAEDGLADVAARKIGAIAAHTAERIVYAAVDRETKPVLPGVDAGELRPL